MALECVETVGYSEGRMHVTICLFQFWFQIERWENGNFNYWQGSGISGTPVPLGWTVPYLFAEDWTFILQVWSERPETKAGKIIFLGASVRLVFLLHLEVWRIIFICCVLRIVVISCCLGRWGRLPFCPRDGSSRFVGNAGTPAADLSATYETTLIFVVTTAWIWNLFLCSKVQYVHCTHNLCIVQNQVHVLAKHGHLQVDNKNSFMGSRSQNFTCLLLY